MNDWNSCKLFDSWLMIADNKVSEILIDGITWWEIRVKKEKEKKSKKE